MTGSVSVAPSIPRREYADRRNQLRQDAAASGMDALLVWSAGGGTLDRFANVFYLTNCYMPCPTSPDLPGHWSGLGQAALVLPVNGPAVLVAAHGDWRADLVEVDESVPANDLYGGVATVIRELGLQNARIGLTDEERIPLGGFRALCRDLPQVEFARADDLIMRRRQIKSPAEIEMMRYASIVGSAIMSSILDQAVEGATDGICAGAGFEKACRSGAQIYDFAFASGPDDGHIWWPRLPSWDHSRRYEHGDIVHPDIYGAVGGYFFDFTRSRVVGDEPTPEQRELLDAVVACILAACEAARAGATPAHLHEACQAELDVRGFGRDGRPRAIEDYSDIGHGLGLGWETPILTSSTDTRLEAGMVLCVERHVSWAGVGTARHEETVLVTEAEPEILTATCPAQWWP